VEVRDGNESKKRDDRDDVTPGPGATSRDIWDPKTHV
jgi:hypothetical protein